MPFFSWSEDFAVDNAMIDGDHKQMIHLFNKLHGAMTEGKGSDVIVHVLAELFEYVEGHFKREDDLMIRHPYAGFVAHKSEHQRLLQEARALQKRFIEGSLLMPVPTLCLLRDGLLAHFLRCDKELAVAVRNGSQSVNSPG